MVIDAALKFVVDAWWETPHNPRKQGSSTLRSLIFSQRGLLFVLLAIEVALLVVALVFFIQQDSKLLIYGTTSLPVIMLVPIVLVHRRLQASAKQGNVLLYEQLEFYVELDATLKRYGLTNIVQLEKCLALANRVLDNKDKNRRQLALFITVPAPLLMVLVMPIVSVMNSMGSGHSEEILEWALQAWFFIVVGVAFFLTMFQIYTSGNLAVSKSKTEKKLAYFCEDLSAYIALGMNDPKQQERLLRLASSRPDDNGVQV